MMKPVSLVRPRRLKPSLVQLAPQIMPVLFTGPTNATNHYPGHGIGGSTQGVGKVGPTSVFEGGVGNARDLLHLIRGVCGCCSECGCKRPIIVRAAMLSVRMVRLTRRLCHRGAHSRKATRMANASSACWSAEDGESLRPNTLRSSG